MWILYHLFIILIAPNGSSYVGRSLERAIFPYAATLGLNYSWNFFSPDPAHTMYIKYTLYFKDDMEQDKRDPVVGYFPEAKEKGEYRLSHRRVLYAMRFLVLDPSRLETVLSPWLCKSEPDVTHVNVQHIIDSIPPLDKAVFDKNQSLRDLGKEYGFIDKTFRCGDKADEVSL